VLAGTALPGPHLVHLRADAQDLELSALALAELHPEAHHPLDVLVGFTAPEAWLAIGVVADGTAHHLGASPASTRVRLAFLVARNGVQASALVARDEGVLPAPGKEPAEGLLDDALHRCLDLPTAPPASSPSRWLTSSWLDRLTLHAASRPTAHPVRKAWQALAQHPLATTVGGRGRVDGAALRQALAAVDEAGWEGVRLAAAGTASSSEPVAAAAELVSPALARWADAGSLARLLEAELPPSEFLLDAAQATLPPSVLACVRAVADPDPS
jgi:hypothetical protein